MGSDDSEGSTSCWSCTTRRTPPIHTLNYKTFWWNTSLLGLEDVRIVVILYSVFLLVTWWFKVTSDPQAKFQKILLLHFKIKAPVFVIFEFRPSVFLTVMRTLLGSSGTFSLTCSCDQRPDGLFTLASSSCPITTAGLLKIPSYQICKWESNTWGGDWAPLLYY